MLHLQLYYSLRRFPSALFSKTIELNPLGRWTMKRPHSINTYLASLDHEDGTLNGVQYCRKTSKSLLPVRVEGPTGEGRGAYRKGRSPTSSYRHRRIERKRER